MTEELKKALETIMKPGFGETRPAPTVTGEITAWLRETAKQIVGSCDYDYAQKTAYEVAADIIEERWGASPNAAQADHIRSAAEMVPQAEAVVTWPDELPLHREARKRMMNDATQQDYATHLIRVTWEAALRQHQSEVEALRAKMRMIVSHASGGGLQDIDLSPNDICVRISQHHNRVYEEGKKRGATKAEADNARLKELLTAPIMAGYAMHYGPRCRECADSDGVCELTGMPCGGRLKATMFVCEALEYGFKNGFVDPQYAVQARDAQG